jgi:hypothetical protein
MTKVKVEIVGMEKECEVVQGNLTEKITTLIPHITLLFVTLFDKYIIAGFIINLLLYLLSTPKSTLKIHARIVFNFQLTWLILYIIAKGSEFLLIGYLIHTVYMLFVGTMALIGIVYTWKNPRRIPFFYIRYGFLG